VAVDRGGPELEVIPAEFVVDASGKNTHVPEFLDRVGVGAPEVEQDIINCFYSTMYHRVPPERQWDDKVMMICYAYRPYEDTYAAQYYTDSSRTILSTTLVAYNCYSPPRTAREFREFADLMPSPVVGENIDGLEPASPIYNFRYPNMLRLHYEKKRNLPRALLVVGDAYTSADPVSGLGMTLALKEVREMALLLAKYGPGHPELPRRYFRRIAKMADTAWFVIREQNLRFDWLKDVDKKRPFYFRALTWYMDRVMELVHDDPDTYGEFLAVVHLVRPPAALMTPKVAGKVLGKWARTRLSGQKTLIARNYENRTVPPVDHLVRTEELSVGLVGSRTH
ncbi:oxygenase, partial [Mycolicibacterium austroafricanum]